MIRVEFEDVEGQSGLGFEPPQGWHQFFEVELAKKRLESRHSRITKLYYM